MSHFYKLTISNIDQLTPDAVGISFAIPAELQDTFAFSAGQYITIKHKLGDEELRRAYSISSSNNIKDKIRVGIKKVDKGSFSVYANEKLKEGAVLEVMPPDGRFIFENTSEEKHIAAFASGSGITPIMSIATSVLASHKQSTFVLVYGNRTPEESMFYDEIAVIQEKYNERFFLQNVYSRAVSKGAKFGRINEDIVNYIVKNKFKDIDFDAYYLCGPEGMITMVKDTLGANEVVSEKVLFELFSTPEDAVAPAADGSTTKLTIIADDEQYSFDMDRSETVLDIAIEEDIDVAYSCQGGICSSCVARVKEGKARMINNQILTDSDIEEGLILTCQAHPETPTLIVDFDDV